MSSTNEQLNSADAPHFFKILLDDDNIQQGKLEIPRKFARKNGKDMSDPVTLNVPSGAIWQVQLTKCDHAGVWSLHGLKAFVEHYSLELGHFLLFRYHGKSSFLVIICDTSALEIDYPLHDGNTHVQEHKFDGESSKRLEVLDDLSPSRRSTGCKTRSKGEYLGKQKRKIDSNTEGFEGTEECGGLMAADKRRRMAKPLGVSREGRALEVASSFKSRNPFFAVSMFPTYVCSRFRLTIPNNIVTKYFVKNYGNISLNVSNGRTWDVKYNRYNPRPRHRHPRVEFSKGWKVFVQDNKLEAGDVCVFELINGNDFSLHVVIFRACEDPNSQHLAAKKVSKTEETDDIIDVSVETLDDFSPREIATKKSSLPTDNTRCLTYQESIGEYRSEFPFFRKTMCWSYLHSNYLGVPSSFAKKYINKRSIFVRLQVADKSWVVKSCKYADGSCKFCCWSEFARENSLREGDNCIFELISTSDMLFKVSIFRYALVKT